MNSIGNIPSLPLPTLKAAAPARGDASAIPQKAPEVRLQQPEVRETGAAQSQRLATVQKAAEQIANVSVLGDRSFTIFKDANGQLVTRFRKNGTNQVTYFPEPDLFKKSGATLVNKLA